MPVSLSSAADLYNSLKKEWNAPSVNLKRCGDLLTQLKIALTELSFLPSESSESSQEELLLARDALEIGALWSIQSGDVSSFDRYYAQLFSYYFDYGKTLPPAANQNLILGLNLLRLLSEQKIAEFHMAIELLDINLLRSDPYIKFPVQLEQHIMEGLHNKVFSAAEAVPHPSYKLFMDILLQTLRNHAESEKLKLSVGDKKHQNAENINMTEYADQIIRQSLQYAKELERIV